MHLIRGLADVNCDGKLDINEFSVACKLITMKLKGLEMPPVRKYDYLIFRSIK